jgi:shikimate 5-dehydrogenase
VLLAHHASNRAAALLTPSMFVGDVIAGHGVTPFLEAAEAAGCRTANGGYMVEAAQDNMADFMQQKPDAPNS